MSLVKRAKSNRLLQDNKITIDEEKGWIFASEEELYNFFVPQISELEREFYTSRPDDDFSDTELNKFEQYLDIVLDRPLEIWRDEDTLPGFVLYNYIGEYYDQSLGCHFYYVAVTHHSGKDSAFVYLHFATRKKYLSEQYRRGECIHNRQITELDFATLEGDSLGEGDELSIGLFKAMLALRSELDDIAREDFKKYKPRREETIQEPDEVWRSVALEGQVLVTFIREFTEGEIEGFTYIVVTQEEAASNVHALLFSFPTKDRSLADRYRHGDNLQTGDISQEASH